MRTHLTFMLFVAVLSVGCGPGSAGETTVGETATGETTVGETTAGETSGSTESAGTEESGETGIDDEPFDGCVKIERVINPEAQKLCAITQTGLVLVRELDGAGDLVLERLDVESGSFSEIMRMPTMQGCMRLAEDTTTGQIWMYGRTVAIDGPNRLYAFDSEGTFLFDVATDYDPLDLSLSTMLATDGLLYFAGMVADINGFVFDGILEARDSDGLLLWTRLDYEAPIEMPGDPMYTLDTLREMVETDEGLAFLGYRFGIDSSRVTFHMVGFDGAEQWATLAVDDDYDGPYFSVGARTEAGGAGLYRTRFEGPTFTSPDNPGDVTSQTTLEAFDLSGELLWSDVQQWPEIELAHGPGTVAAGQSLLSLFVAPELGTGIFFETTLPRAYFVRHDFDGQLECSVELDDPWLGQIDQVEAVSPQRLLVLADVHVPDEMFPDSDDVLLVLQVNAD